MNDILKPCKDQVVFTIKKKFSEEDITLSIGNCYKLMEFEKIQDSSEEQLILQKVWLT